MSLDPNTIVSSIVGGLIAISGSIAVAVLYIKNQNKSENKKRLHKRIQETYFEKGILPMQAALSEYGTCTVFAFADARMWMTRCLKDGGGTKLLKDKLEEISKRPAVMDLINHNFSLAMPWFPTLQKFGTPFYTSLKRTFQLYSSILADVVSLKGLQKNIEASSVDEVARSLGVLAKILDMTVMYLEKRFTSLSDCFWQKDVGSYEEFLKIFLEEKYKTFLSVMDKYLEGLTQLMDALRSAKSEDRARATLGFSKWLGENMDYNPLE